MTNIENEEHTYEIKITFRYPMKIKILKLSRKSHGKKILILTMYTYLNLFKIILRVVYNCKKIK